MLMILFQVFVLLIAGYFVQQSNWPDPAKWLGFAIVFVLAILLFMKMSGISLN